MPKITKKEAKASPSAPAASKPVEDRKMAYPEVQVQLCKGDDVMTVEMAKNLLGWEEESDDVKFGTDFAFVDFDGKKVRMTNNTKNRPLSESWAKTIAQEHLQKRWRLNGETIVVGQYGEVLSGQHRLVGLVLAEQMRQKEDHWADNWPDEVTMECVVVFGIDERDDVVNSLDTGKARTLGDVLYRSELLAKYDPKTRRAMARACDYATRTYWYRTGMNNDAFAPTKTHAEAMSLLTSHPKFVETIAHVVEEDAGGNISKFISPGVASALCYMMGASGSDPDKYDRTEKSLNLKKLKDAHDFFVMLAGGDASLADLRKAILSLRDEETGASGSLAERTALIVKAWNQYVTEGKVTAAGVKLSYYKDALDNTRLGECPALGGVDLGDPKDDAASEDDDAPTEEEVKERAAEVKKESLKSKKDDSSADDDEFERVRLAHPDHVLWFEGKTDYLLLGSHANLAKQVLGVKGDGKVNGLDAVRFKLNQYQPAMTAFNEAGHEVAVVKRTPDGTVLVNRIKPIVKKKGKK